MAVLFEHGHTNLVLIFFSGGGGGGGDVSTWHHACSA